MIRRKAQELHERFVKSFSEARAEEVREKCQRFIAINIAGQRYLLSLSELSGLHHGLEIQPTPLPVSRLLGLTGIAGAVVPVYSLAELLGHTQDLGAPEWLVTTAGASPMGFGFSQYEGYRDVSQGRLIEAEQRGETVRQIARLEDGLWSVVDIKEITRELLQ